MKHSDHLKQRYNESRAKLVEIEEMVVLGGIKVDLKAAKDELNEQLEELRKVWEDEKFYEFLNCNKKCKCKCKK